MSDTVGFIRDLPHKLVEAFRATLQEAAEADLLLHVVDASSPHLREQMLEVERVLEEIGAQDIPQILVFNKTDLLEPTRQPREVADQLETEGHAPRPRVFISAATGQGLDRLRQVIAAAMPSGDGPDHASVWADGDPRGRPLSADAFEGDAPSLN